jgi:hypothetical protein
VVVVQWLFAWTCQLLPHEQIAEHKAKEKAEEGHSCLCLCLSPLAPKQLAAKKQKYVPSFWSCGRRLHPLWIESYEVNTGCGA